MGKLVTHEEVSEMRARNNPGYKTPDEVAELCIKNNQPIWIGTMGWLDPLTAKELLFRLSKKYNRNVALYSVASGEECGIVLPPVDTRV